MKLPKCEIKLPPRYRWVKIGEKMLPDDLTYRFANGFVDWVPVDVLAKIFPKGPPKVKSVIRRMGK